MDACAVSDTQAKNCTRSSGSLLRKHPRGELIVLANIKSNTLIKSHLGFDFRLDQEIIISPRLLPRLGSHDKSLKAIKIR